MQYKTIVLELLEQQTELQQQLRRSRTFLLTVELLAKKLKARHLAWMAKLRRNSPGSEKSQIASEAMELALRELEDGLTASSSKDDTEAVPLDQIIAHLTSQSSHG